MSGQAGARTRPSATRPRVPILRLALLLLAGVAVLAGLDAALLRLGLGAPVESIPLASAHGVLMVYGFLGTAITLERAVALQSGPSRRDRWAYASPLASGLGGVIVVASAAGLPLPGGSRLPGAAWTVSMLLLVVIYLRVWQRQESYAVLVQILGAVVGAGGAALWARGGEPAVLVAWWAGFLVLTIVGERLELARIAFLARGTEPRVVAESCAVLVTLLAALVAPDLGYPLLGLALGILVVDVAIHDVAWRTVRIPGLPRFVAVCLLTGYAWALVPALAWIVGGPAWSGYRYDIVVHALTIGFALSMVIAHAPVIVPAVIRRDLPYHPAMWAVWALLQVGLVVRLLAGARSAEGAWQFGGAVDVVALLAFVVTTVTLVLTAARRARPRSRAGST